MSYYYLKKVSSDFESSIGIVTEKLKDKGFGVLTEIDVQQTLKKKLDVDFYKSISISSTMRHLDSIHLYYYLLSIMEQIQDYHGNCMQAMNQEAK